MSALATLRGLAADALARLSAVVRGPDGLDARAELREALYQLGDEVTRHKATRRAYESALDELRVLRARGGR